MYRLLEDILNFIANPLVLLLMSMPVFIFVGIFLGVWLTHPRKNRIIRIDPESGRGIEYEIEHEDTVNALCKPVGNTPPQRFIKLHKALNVIRKGPFKLQNYSLYLARLGTAYTQMVQEEGKKIVVPLRDAIRNILGDKLYERIPNVKPDYAFDKIEKSEVGVTIELPATEALTAKGLKSLSSDDLRRSDIDTFIGAIARGVRSQFKAPTGEYIKIIFILGSGIAIGIVLSLVFGWGGTHYVEASKAMIGTFLV